MSISLLLLFLLCKGEDCLKGCVRIFHSRPKLKMYSLNQPKPTFGLQGSNIFTDMRGTVENILE